MRLGIVPGVRPPLVCWLRQTWAAVSLRASVVLRSGGSWDAWTAPFEGLVGVGDAVASRRPTEALRRG